jgi:hypothetical protein
MQLKAIILLASCGGLSCAAPLLPAEDPAAAVRCVPSRECAIELAKAYGRVEAREAGENEHYLHTLGSVTWALVNSHDRTAPAAVDEFIAAVRAAAKNPAPTDLQTIAAMQMVIGRRADALVTVREIGAPNETLLIVEAISRRAFEEGRIEDANAALQLVSPDQRLGIGLRLIDERLQDRDPAAAHRVAAALGIDARTSLRHTVRLLLAGDSPDRFDEALALLERQPRGAAASVLPHLEIARALTPRALPLLRFARTLSEANRATSKSADYECKWLAESFAHAGGVDEANALTASCATDDRDELRADVAFAHAFAGNFGAARKLADAILDRHSRADTISWIAEARVLVGKEPLDQAFAEVRDPSLRVERMLEIADDFRDQKRIEDARVVLNLAARAARAEADAESRSSWLAQTGEKMSELGGSKSAMTLLPYVTLGKDRVYLLCAIGDAQAKSGDRKRAADSFAMAHKIAVADEFDSEEMRNLIEWQARATLTREALAAVRAMAPPEDGRDISRDLAFEAVIIAMAKRGEIADAFALARSLQRGRSSTFLRIFEVLAGLD